MQAVGGAREVTVFSHREQIADVTKYHAPSISFTYRVYSKPVLDYIDACAHNRSKLNGIHHATSHRRLDRCTFLWRADYLPDRALPFRRRYAEGCATRPVCVSRLGRFERI